MEMVFLPVFRLIWWPAVWVSSSAGVMVTAALASVGVVVMVVIAAEAAAEAVYSVVVPEKVPMSMPEMASANRSALSDRVAKMVRVITTAYVLVVVPLVTVTVMVFAPVFRLYLVACGLGVVVGGGDGHRRAGVAGGGDDGG